MRDDITLKLVESKCEVLKRSGLWPSSPTMRPAAWLNNFEEQDRPVAAKLLDRFTFCNDKTVNSMLKSSWLSLGDGFEKGFDIAPANELLASLSTASFTPIIGEKPNPTDSGYLFCRKARQILRWPEDLIIKFEQAILHAKAGNTIVFVDDFVGSGDQFKHTWTLEDSKGDSFESIQLENNFTAIYLTLITTDYGLDEINNKAPKVAVCRSHVINEKSTIHGLMDSGRLDRTETLKFLDKYSGKLIPADEYMKSTPSFMIYGYADRGLLLGFEHSVPDATLPIFWSPGVGDWEPLIERV